MTSGPAPPDDDGGDQELAEVDALEDRLRIGGHGGRIPPSGPLRVLTPPLRCGKTRRTLAPLRPGPVSVLARVPGGLTFWPQDVGPPSLSAQSGEALTWPQILASP
jgi:hypothetical protein